MCYLPSSQSVPMMGHVAHGVRLHAVVVSLAAATALFLSACGTDSGRRDPAPSSTKPNDVSTLPKPENASTPQVSEIAALGRQVLRSYTVRTSQHDPRYWRGGSFVAANGPSCWSCYDTAATAAAVLS